MKKCLLISPPDLGPSFPRGLMEIASFLKAKECPASVLILSHALGYPGGSMGKSDWIKSDEVEPIIRDAIRESGSIVVGVSTQHTKNFPDCLKVLEICKALNARLVTVIGGPHVTFLDTACLESPFVDVVVRGEGEWTMLELMRAVEGGKDLANVKGITFRRNGRIVRTPDRPFGDLSELPAIDFGLLPVEYMHRAGVSGMLTRGCIGHCTFCAEGAFWKDKRSFPVQRVIDEMRILEDEYENPMQALQDSTTSIGSREFLDLCSEIVNQKVELSPQFFVLSRVDTITEEGIGAMKKAGIRNVRLGIESASPKVLRMMNKNIAFDQAAGICGRLRRKGIHPLAFWVIGHPGDNLEEAEFSLGKLKYLHQKDLITESLTNLFVPFPGTPHFADPERYGIEILSYDWYRWDTENAAEPVCQLKDFSAQQISAYYAKAKAIEKAFGSVQRYSWNPQDYDRKVSDRT